MSMGLFVGARFGRGVWPLLLGALLLSASDGYAGCSKVAGIPDINCDGRAHIVVVGDSFVFGTGDTKNGGRGGYVLRAKKALRGATIDGFGTKGLDTRQLLKRLQVLFASTDTSALKEALFLGDFVVLDLGRNDRWFFGLPSEAYRNLKRIRTILRTEIARQTGRSPVIVTAVLMLPNRGSQGPWVKELNRLILKGSRLQAPADLRFDIVSKRLLSADQLHPTSIGYDELAKTFIAYVKKVLAKRF